MSHNRTVLFTLQQIEAAMRPDTILVSIMHVNNEIGVIQDLAAIGELCRARKFCSMLMLRKAPVKLTSTLTQ